MTPLFLSRSRLPRPRCGFSLLEVIAAVIIAATVAAISIHYLQTAGTTSKQRSCDLTRQLLQNDADRYEQATGAKVARNLRQLQTPEFSGDPLPACPVTNHAYQCDTSGVVFCPEHERSRAK